MNIIVTVAYLLDGVVSATIEHSVRYNPDILNWSLEDQAAAMKVLEKDFGEDGCKCKITKIKLPVEAWREIEMP